MRGATIRIGFVSTRLAGTDGVSLEVQKWAAVLTELGNECFYFAGESDRPPERTHLVEEAHFKHPDIQRLNGELFERRVRATATSNAVQSLSQHLKSRLQEFVGKFDLELLITQNALSLPMNVPLGIALGGVLPRRVYPPSPTTMIFIGRELASPSRLPETTCIWRSPLNCLPSVMW